MKSHCKTYGSVAALLAVLLAAAVGVTALAGNLTAADSRRDTPTVLATTYPVYAAAAYILGSTETLTLTRLDGAASGCLHDYQMSPADRRGVQEAQVILMNGAGAETFLHGIVDEGKCVDTSTEVSLLCSAHDHDHAAGEHHHEEAYNEHLWLSPARYQKQVLAVMNALIAVDGDNEAFYRSNAENYLRHVDAIRQELEALAAALEGRPCVLFHDSMAYLAADLGLDVQLILSVEGESGLSAADLKQVEALAAQYPDLLLLYDTQYALRYEGVAGTAVFIHTAVQEDWLTAMEENLKTLKKIVG